MVTTITRTFCFPSTRRRLTEIVATEESWSGKRPASFVLFGGRWRWRRGEFRVSQTTPIDACTTIPYLCTICRRQIPNSIVGTIVPYYCTVLLSSYYDTLEFSRVTWSREKGDQIHGISIPHIMTWLARYFAGTIRNNYFGFTTQRY